MALRDEYQFILYDTYYQLLSDEFISSMYRKIIRGDTLFTDTSYTTYRALQDDVKIMFGSTPEDGMISVDSGKDRTDPWLKDLASNKLSAKIHSTKNEAAITLNFTFCNDAAINAKKCVLWDAPIVGLKVILYIINLMAINALEHGGKDPQLYIVFGVDGVTFTNSIDASRVDEERKQLLKLTKIPPWAFGETDTHITYWTLTQSSKIASSHHQPIVMVEPKIFKDKDERGWFTVKYKFFS